MADAWALKACEPGCNILQSESLGCLVLCVDVECVDVECVDVECVDVECVDVECVDVDTSLMLAVEFDIKSHPAVHTITMDDA